MAICHLARRIDLHTDLGPPASCHLGDGDTADSGTGSVAYLRFRAHTRIACCPPRLGLCHLPLLDYATYPTRLGLCHLPALDYATYPSWAMPPCLGLCHLPVMGHATYSSWAIPTFVRFGLCYLPVKRPFGLGYATRPMH